ncbi:Rossmann-like domain-containing protein [Methanospirillum sp.]
MNTDTLAPSDGQDEGLTLSASPDIDLSIGGSILEETKNRLMDRYGDQIETITLDRVVIGIFYTGVQLSDGSAGICFTPIKAIPESVCCPSSARAMPKAGKLKGMKVTDVFKYLTQPAPIKRAIAIATLNALSDGIWRNNPEEGAGRYRIDEGDDIFSFVHLEDVHKAVVIGALIPVIKSFKEKEIPYRIAELDIRTLKAEEIPFFVSQEDLPVELATADMVIISGTTLLNDTLEGILQACNTASKIFLIGPTATMLPESFFKRKVSVLAGNRVVDSEKILDVLIEGGSGYHFYGDSSRKVMIIKE